MKSLFERSAQSLANRLQDRASLIEDGLAPKLALDAEIRALYKFNPVGYCSEILGVTLTPTQAEILTELVAVRRVIVLASHGIGKSFLMACAVNWFFDCWDNSEAMTTAPTANQVNRIVWKEIRLLRRRRNGAGLLPKASKMEFCEGWNARGFTANSGDAFQGTHSKGGVFLGFDEATGIKKEYFDAGEGMMVDENCFWLMICNPTDPGCELKNLCDTGQFKIIQASAIDHPNVLAHIRGDDAIPFPGAVTYGWIDARVNIWCSRLNDVDGLAPGRAVEWPPESGNFWLPGPLFDGRVLGRWPSISSNSIWSDWHWQSSLIRQEIDESENLEIGVDVARFGKDFTSFIVRRGCCVLYHETYNGQDVARTIGRCTELAAQFKLDREDPRGVAIKIDDNGVGGGVVDVLRANGYRSVRVDASHAAFEPERFPNRRSELWFNVRDRAEELRLDLSRLLPESLALLKRQALTPTYRYDGQARKVAESKDTLSKPDRLGRSPDDMDALNLAFAPAVSPKTMSWDEFA